MNDDKNLGRTVAEWAGVAGGIGFIAAPFVPGVIKEMSRLPDIITTIDGVVIRGVDDKARKDSSRIFNELVESGITDRKIINQELGVGEPWVFRHEVHESEFANDDGSDEEQVKAVLKSREKLADNVEYINLFKLAQNIYLESNEGKQFTRELSKTPNTAILTALDSVETVLNAHKIKGVDLGNLESLKSTLRAFEQGTSLRDAPREFIKKGGKDITFVKTFLESCVFNLTKSEENEYLLHEMRDIETDEAINNDRVKAAILLSIIVSKLSPSIENSFEIAENSFDTAVEDTMPTVKGMVSEAQNKWAQAMQKKAYKTPITPGLR